MHDKLLIGFPVYLEYPLHVEFTQETVASVKTKYDHRFAIVSNHISNDLVNLVRGLKFPSDPDEVFWMDNEKGNNVSAAWNQIIQYGIDEGFDYIIIPNNDIIFRHDAIDNLIKFAKEHPDFLMWTASEHVNPDDLETKQIDNNFDEHPHFSCFMVDKNFIKRLSNAEPKDEPYPGLFDENYAPAYFEDGDMHNRILRAKLIAAKTGSAQFYHYGSRTIKVDDDLNRENGVTYEENRKYFRTKWGFDPHGKVVTNDDPIRFKYKVPFDDYE